LAKVNIALVSYLKNFLILLIVEFVTFAAVYYFKS